MKRKLKAIITVLLFSNLSCLYSQQYFRIFNPDYSYVDYGLFSHILRFSSLGEIIVSPSSGGSEITYLFSQVKEVRFPTVVTIKSVFSNEKEVRCFVSENKLYIKGFSQTSPMRIKIMSLSGNTLFQSYQLVSEAIDLSNFSSGIYFAQVGHYPLKFVYP